MNDKEIRRIQREAAERTGEEVYRQLRQIGMSPVTLGELPAVWQIARALYPPYKITRRRMIRDSSGVWWRVVANRETRLRAAPIFEYTKDHGGTESAVWAEGGAPYPTQERLEIWNALAKDPYEVVDDE